MVTHLDTVGSAVWDILLYALAHAKEVGRVSVDRIRVSPAMGSEVGAGIVGGRIGLGGLVDKGQGNIVDARVAVGPQVFRTTLALSYVSVMVAFGMVGSLCTQ